MHDEDFQPGVAGSRRAAVIRVAVRVVDIVADPDLEEIAEDVQGLGLAGAAGQKAEERSTAPGDRGDEVQIGDEEIKRSRPSR